MEQNKDWVKKYFTDEQLKQMDELSKQSYTEEAARKLKAYHTGEWTEEDQKRINEQYTHLGAELQRLVASGADPASPDAQALARLQNRLSFGFTRGDQDIQASVNRWWENFYALPEEQRPMKSPYSKTEAEFLKQALKIYSQRQQD